MQRYRCGILGKTLKAPEAKINAIVKFVDVLDRSKRAPNIG